MDVLISAFSNIKEFNLYFGGKPQGAIVVVVIKLLN